MHVKPTTCYQYKWLESKIISYLVLELIIWNKAQKRSLKLEQVTLWLCSITYNMHSMLPRDSHFCGTNEKLFPTLNTNCIGECYATQKICDLYSVFYLLLYYTHTWQRHPLVYHLHRFLHEPTFCYRRLCSSVFQTNNFSINLLFVNIERGEQNQSDMN